MTDIKLLKKKIKDSGMTITFIAKKTGMLRETFYNRMRKNGDFRASEIAALTKILNLSKSERDCIFFAVDSELNSHLERGDKNE